MSWSCHGHGVQDAIQLSTCVIYLLPPSPRHFQCMGFRGVFVPRLETASTIIHFEHSTFDLTFNYDLTSIYSTLCHSLTSPQLLSGAPTSLAHPSRSLHTHPRTHRDTHHSTMEEHEKPPVADQAIKAQRRVSSSRYLKLSRLPTLQEVLDRRTRAPLDLFCFYVSAIPPHGNMRTRISSSDTRSVLTPFGQIFLQRESAEDALDFWLDVQQHENMCKAYFKVRPARVAHVGQQAHVANLGFETVRSFCPSRLAGICHICAGQWITLFALVESPLRTQFSRLYRATTIFRSHLAHLPQPAFSDPSFFPS